MGKAANNKKKAARQRRNDPTGLNNVPDVQTASDAPATTQAAPIVKKLASASLDDRAWAATALSNLVLDAHTRRSLLADDIIGQLLSVLSTEGHAEVIVEVCGALRNLAVAGGEEVCMELGRRNGVAPLMGLLEKVQTWISTRLADAAVIAQGGTVPQIADKVEVENRRYCFDIAESVVQLLWSLCEASDQVVKFLTQTQVIPFLMELVKHANDIPWKLVQVSAQCLHTLTDENPQTHSLFEQHPDYAEKLAAIASGSESAFDTWNENRMLLRPLSAGILYNIREAPIAQTPVAKQAIYTAIFRAIESCLGCDIPAAQAAAVAISKAMEETAAKLPSGDASDGNDAGVDIQEIVNQENARMGVLEGHMETVQLALELLANVAVVEEGHDDWAVEGMDGDGESGDEMEDDDEDVMEMMEADMATIKEDEAGAPNGTEAPLDPVLNMLLGDFPAIFTRVVQLIAPPKALAPETSSDGPVETNLTAQLIIIQTRALIALTNILSTPLASRFLTSSAITNELWDHLFIAAQSSGLGTDDFHQDVLDAAWGATWAVTRHMDSSPATRITPSETHITTLQQSSAQHLGSTPIPDAVRQKAANILTLLAKQSPSIPVTTQITIHLLVLFASTLQQSSSTPQSHAASVSLASDILNGFYDIFPDALTDPTDCVYVANNMNAKLKELIPAFRTAVKTVDKRKFREVRERAEEALLNMRAFVDYKEKERRNMPVRA
ncbi:armadillo-type protein [Fimicolochytrium jonesii]|uniref:armadillo-type protein n=1 Tax=Fimicolochytrium jonesii TaxID=1396493 RepID=UPI0022FE1187|nr:armadillo-type protein [Fimicolochytrium jonesii]KAI8825993.1 armadillo-type protein [Fimicolochytrium jonesii]